MLALLWAGSAGVLLYVSLGGWGRLALHRLDPDQPWPVAAAVGMALACVAGGALNLLRLISAELLVLLLLAGLVLAAAHAYGRRAECAAALAGIGRRLRQRPAAAAAAAAAGLVVLTLLASAAIPLNEHDDQHAYHVFPHRMLSQGHLGEDPFNERRVGTLGGQSFLGAMVLTVVPQENARVLDPGLGWLVFVGLVLAHARRRRLAPAAALGLVALWHLYEPPLPNLSSGMTGLALFYALIMLFTAPDFHRGRRGAVLAALLAAALVSLKTTHVVGLAAVGLALTLFDPRVAGWARLAGGARIAALALVLTAPWMVALHQSSGTLWYPFLGTGYAADPTPDSARLALAWSDLDRDFLLANLHAWLLLPHLLSGWILVAVGAAGGLARRAFVGAWLGAALLGLVALGLQRYAYPFAFAAFAFLALESLPPGGGVPEARTNDRPAGARRWLALLGLAFFAGMSWSGGLGSIETKVARIARFAPDSAHAFYREKARSAQRAVPEGAAILTLLARPYPLDFGRNPIHIVDHAGSRGPAPGLPLSAADRLAAYLRDRGIRYLLYSHGDEAAYGRRAVGHRLGIGSSPYGNRVRRLARDNIRLRDLVSELAQRYPRVHDDGYALVLDLRGTPRAAR